MQGHAGRRAVAPERRQGLGQSHLGNLFCRKGSPTAGFHGFISGHHCHVATFLGERHLVRDERPLCATGHGKGRNRGRGGRRSSGDEGPAWPAPAGSFPLHLQSLSRPVEWGQPPPHAPQSGLDGVSPDAKPCWLPRLSSPEQGRAFGPLCPRGAGRQLERGGSSGDRARRSGKRHKYVEVRKMQSRKGNEMQSVQTTWETPLPWKVSNSKSRRLSFIW